MKRKIKKIIILIIIAVIFYFILNNIIPLNKGTELYDGIVKVNNSNEYTKEELEKEVNLLILVNKNYGLSKDYKPKELVIPDILFTSDISREEKHVDKRIVEDLENLINSARKEGIILLGNSGYRSYETQNKIYKKRVKSEGEEMAEAYVAKPGFSEHQTGLAIDITNEENFLTQGSREAIWLEENCHKFGFIIRYPYGKEDITGIAYEPWHIRYVGKEAAKYIYENNITLEEYLGL